MIDYSIDDKGAYVASGCFAHFLEHIAETEKLKLIYTPVKSSQLGSVIREEKVDLIPCTFETPKRRQIGDFRGFLYTTRLEGVCRKKGRKVFELADLWRRDVRIVVAPGEIGSEFCETELPDFKENPYRRFSFDDHERVEEMMHTVAARGGCDVAIADALSCRSFCRAHPETVVLAFADKPENVLGRFRVGTLIPGADEQYRDWLNERFKAAREVPWVQQEEERTLRRCLGAFTKRPL